MAIYELKGVRPLLGRDVFVAEGARVIGDVHLGDGASVWFNAVLRGDYMPIRVGARTNIQDNAVVHITSGINGATIGDDVTVGHSAIVHGCTVGSGCLVGMGSIVLDGAIVGDESFIAAGSLVTPGTVIPPRSFVVGRPAKVARTVSERDLASLREAASRYAQYAGEFRAGCERIDG
ncbi:MAG TPA: gamma carbonic anhydrase family protein [Polyangiaceae bacterium]|jgi:carbonic anhydrase/acetyltransferase-like protein (isoleucine patch superfamily)|nr:gamma carbonic anhydrase family protein [Polyangiaceae bacterium]